MGLRARTIAVLAILTSLICGRTDASPEWKDGKGVVFTGEPVEAIGSQLLFRSGPLLTKAVAMRAFSAEDCVQFYRAVAGQPPRAERWSEAKGELARELRGKLHYYITDGFSRKVDYVGVPEPEFFVVVFWGPSRLGLLLDDLLPFTQRMERVFPGRLATVVVRQPLEMEPPQHPNRINSFHPDWLVTDARALSMMPLMTRFSEERVNEGYSIYLMTRRGVPLLGGPLNSMFDITSFVDGASDLFWQLNPANPRTAQDRLHYLRAVRPVQFAQGKADPLLLIDPFHDELLREREVRRIEADVTVGPDGAVVQVALSPESEIPAGLTASVSDILRRGTLYLPAIAQGQPAAGTLHYSRKVAPVDPQFIADAAWVKGEARVDVPIKEWQVLKPIHVPQQVFTTVNRVGKDGTVLLNPVTAGRSDKLSEAALVTAFDRDWFTGGGAGSVRAVAGTTQEVDGENYTWKTVIPQGVFVDLLGAPGSREYDHCIAYAWTEVDVAKETEGWMGFGSDDGAKVWFNGILVDDKWTTRRSRLDDDVVPVRLKKGKNQILIKVQNYTRDWTFTCRLRTRGK